MGLEHVGCDWHGGVVVYNHSAFYGNAAWHGAYYHDAYHAGAYGYHSSYYDRASVDRSVNVNRSTTTQDATGTSGSR